jgi:hypothetical protein
VVASLISGLISVACLTDGDWREGPSLYAEFTAPDPASIEREYSGLARTCADRGLVDRGKKKLGRHEMPPEPRDPNSVPERPPIELGWYVERLQALVRELPDAPRWNSLLIIEGLSLDRERASTIERSSLRTPEQYESRFRDLVSCRAHLGPRSVSENSAALNGRRGPRLVVRWADEGASWIHWPSASISGTR